ncbi:MAG: VWA domain-containing protein [Acidobacteria bacterium]|nr:VWA domain-containing protein [Acidobacteriota bacterium]
MAVFRLATSAGAVLGAASMAAIGNPQPTARQPEATFRSTTRVVTVNAIVTDSHGKAITGLTQDDFELLDDGKPQAVRFFEAINDSPPLPLAPLPPNTFTNQLPASGIPPSVAAVLVDLKDTGWTSQAYALHHVRAFLRKLHPEDRVALYVLDDHLKLLHDFTQDSSELIAAVKRYDLPKQSRPKTEDLSELDRFLAGTAIKLRFEQWAPATGPNLPPPGGPNFPGADRSAYRGKTTGPGTAVTLEAIAKHLATARGRKSLIWVSQRVPPISFDEHILQNALLLRVMSAKKSEPPKYHGLTSVMIGPNGLRDPKDAALRDLRNGLYAGDPVPLLVRLFNDNNIAVYPVSAEGLQGFDLGLRGGLNFLSGAGGPLPTSRVVADVEAVANNTTHMQMEELAKRTGGRAYFNRNDLETGVEHAVEDGRYSYELAYYPDHGDWRGEWRKIEVRIKDPDRYVKPPQGLAQQVKNFLVGGYSVHVLARSGYFALPEPRPEPHQDRRQLLSQTINSLAEATELPLTVRVVAVPGSNSQIRALVSMDANKLLTASGEGHWKGNFELLFAELGGNEFVTPPEPGQKCCTLRRPAEVPVKTFVVDLNQAQHEVAVQKGISASETLMIQPGAATLSIVLHDKNSDAVGSVRIPLGQYSAAPGATPPPQ